MTQFSSGAHDTITEMTNALGSLATTHRRNWEDDMAELKITPQDIENFMHAAQYDHEALRLKVNEISNIRQLRELVIAGFVYAAALHPDTYVHAKGKDS
jgi:hypothetical protein